MDRALCGEHALPLSYNGEQYTCPAGCDLHGTDIQVEPGTHLTVLFGAVFVREDQS